MILRSSMPFLNFSVLSAISSLNSDTTYSMQSLLSVLNAISQGNFTKDGIVIKTDTNCLGKLIANKRQNDILVCYRTESREMSQK